MNKSAVTTKENWMGKYEYTAAVTNYGQIKSTNVIGVLAIISLRRALIYYGKSLRLFQSINNNK